MKVKFLLVILIFIVSLSTFSKVISFSIVASGNHYGDTKDLDRMYNLVKDIEQKKSNVIKINTGNNLTKVKEINEIYYDYYNSLKFDFNFLGKSELFTKSYLRKELKLSSLNIFHENVLPYKIVNKEGYNFAIIGLTDAYDYKEGKKLDYYNELKKLMLDLESGINFIIVVSDLARFENLELINNFKDISLLIETGRDFIEDEVLRFDYRYLVATNQTSLLELTYNPKVAKRILDSNPNFSEKNIFLENYTFISDYSYYEKNLRLSEKIKWNNKKIKRIKKEVFGINKKAFSKNDLRISDNILFFNDIGNDLIDYYDADVVIFPSESIKDNLEQGLYTYKDIQKVFKEDKLLEFKISKADIKDMYLKSIKNRGNKSYLYFVGFDNINAEDKKYYKVLSLENIQESEKIDIVDKKRIGMKEFLIRRQYD